MCRMRQFLPRDHVIQHSFEILRQKLVGFIQNQHFAVFHVGHLFVHEIEDSPRSGNYNMY